MRLKIYRVTKEVYFVECHRIMYSRSMSITQTIKCFMANMLKSNSYPQRNIFFLSLEKHFVYSPSGDGNTLKECHISESNKDEI